MTIKDYKDYKEMMLPDTATIINDITSTDLLVKGNARELLWQLVVLGEPLSQQEREGIITAYAPYAGFDPMTLVQVPPAQEVGELLRLLDPACDAERERWLIATASMLLNEGNTVKRVATRQLSAAGAERIMCDYLGMGSAGLDRIGSDWDDAHPKRGRGRPRTQTPAKR